MELTRKLYFVIPVEAGDGSNMHVHIAPISLQVFEEFAGILGETMADIHAHRLGPTFGPRVAAMLLKDVAMRMGGRDEVGEYTNDAVWKRVQRGFLSEVERLTNVVAEGQTGWETLPYGEAMRGGRLDEDVASEVRNAMVFFMLAWRLYPSTVRLMMVEQAAKLWGGSTSSSDCTAYAAGLPTSTPDANTGVKTVQVSSAPS